MVMTRLVAAATNTFWPISSSSSRRRRRKKKNPRPVLFLL